MGVTFRNLFRKPVTVHYPDVQRLPRPLPGHARARPTTGDRRGELHRLPALRVHLPAAGHQGRDAEGGEAELRQDLHARALRVRVLRAVRAGVPDRRHHHAQDRSIWPPPTAASSCSTRTACTRWGCSSSRRGPPATGCATCRRRPSPPRPRPDDGKTPGADEGGRRVTAETVGFWVGRRAGRLEPRGRARAEPLPRRALPRGGAGRRPAWSSCCSTRRSCSPSSCCSTPAAW